MKNALFMILCLIISWSCYGQEIQLGRKSLKTYDGGPGKDIADRAIKIANLVFNSQEFKDSLINLKFKNKNNTCWCNEDVKLHGDIIYGKDALEILHKNTTQKLKLTFEADGAGLGVTQSCSNSVKIFIENVRRNMEELFSADQASAIAVNLCHEYFHCLGYCHTYRRLKEKDIRANGDVVNWTHYQNDITYRLGWIVYDILTRWIIVERRPI
jgi:hypothetical protein